MADSKAVTFEASLKRLEEIVHILEADSVSLDESVALFREGRTLAQHCEKLLGAAQSEIDRAVSGNAIPLTSPAVESRANGASPAAASFDESADDELPF